MTAHEHVRRAVLPWRDVGEALTECGLPADARTSMSFEEMVDKIRREGQQRAAMSSCMTCWTTVNNHRQVRGDVDLMSTVKRELDRVWFRDSPDRTRLEHELSAIASLIETHRAEWEGLVRDFGEVVSLADQRKQRRERAVRSNL